MTLFTLKQKLLFFLTTIFLFWAWHYLPLADRAEYFNFADKRSIAFIQNIGDVLSNLPFLFIGLWGLWVIRQNKVLGKNYFFALNTIAIGTILTCFGSIYFHLNPTRETLFWDRLPMTLGFSGLIILIFTDRFNQKVSLKLNILFFIFIFISSMTVVGWNNELLTLRPYLLVQLGSLLFSFLALILTPSNVIKNTYLLIAIAFYILAKITEIYDLEIFNRLSFVSGHSLKHLLAAAAIYTVFHPFKNKQTTTISL